VEGSGHGIIQCRSLLREGNHEKFQPVYPVSGPRFEPGIRSRPLVTYVKCNIIYFMFKELKCQRPVKPTKFKPILNHRHCGNKAWNFNIANSKTLNWISRVSHYKFYTSQDTILCPFLSQIYPSSTITTYTSKIHYIPFWFSVFQVACFREIYLPKLCVHFLSPV
jgi:hypothetical protein